MNKLLDEALLAFAERRLSEPQPYLILDARYEKVREAGIILSQAVLVTVAVRRRGTAPDQAVFQIRRDEPVCGRQDLA
jgi:transposase-like protein